MQRAPSLQGRLLALLLAAVVAVWVLEADPADQVRGRCVDGPVA